MQVLRIFRSLADLRKIGNLCLDYEVSRAQALPVPGMHANLLSPREAFERQRRPAAWWRSRVRLIEVKSKQNPLPLAFAVWRLIRRHDVIPHTLTLAIAKSQMERKETPGILSLRLRGLACRVSCGEFLTQDFRALSQISSCDLVGQLGRWGGPLVRSRRPRRLPQGLLIPEEPDWRPAPKNE
jgi:hypothetical protein